MICAAISHDFQRVGEELGPDPSLEPQHLEFRLVVSGRERDNTFLLF
jgi:hypothetical protein